MLNFVRNNQTKVTVFVMDNYHEGPKRVWDIRHSTTFDPAIQMAYSCQWEEPGSMNL